MVMPYFKARPDRGCISPAYPAGIAIDKPVLIKACSPGGMQHQSSAARSNAALPGVAYFGILARGSSSFILMVVIAISPVLFLIK
jgi:hypothetical protein